VRFVDQKTEPEQGLGDWSRAEERRLSRARELDSGVGGIPTALGEGLRHMPHGSDWSSIREAGMNADTQGALPGDAASTDGYGYTQEGHEPVVTRSQRKRLTRWSQKAEDVGPVT